MGSCVWSVVKELAVEFSPTRVTWSEFSREKKNVLLSEQEKTHQWQDPGTNSWQSFLREDMERSLESLCFRTEWTAEVSVVASIPYYRWGTRSTGQERLKTPGPNSQWGTFCLKTFCLRTPAFRKQEAPGEWDKSDGERPVQETWMDLQNTFYNNSYSYPCLSLLKHFTYGVQN